MLPPPIINQSHLSKFSKLIFVSNVFYLVGLIVMIVIFILKIINIIIVFMIVILKILKIMINIVKIIIVMIIVRLPDPPTMARCKGGGERVASNKGVGTGFAFDHMST